MALEPKVARKSVLFLYKLFHPSSLHYQVSHLPTVPKCVHSIKGVPVHVSIFKMQLNLHQKNNLPHHISFQIQPCHLSHPPPLACFHKSALCIGFCILSHFGGRNSSPQSICFWQLQVINSMTVSGAGGAALQSITNSSSPTLQLWLTVEGISGFLSKLHLQFQMASWPSVIQQGGWRHLEELPRLNLTFIHTKDAQMQLLDTFGGCLGTWQVLDEFLC